MTKDAYEAEIPEHELRLDLTRVNRAERIKLMRGAQKAGAVLLNPAIGTLLENAPPEPKQALTHGLEVKLASRAPFSFLLRCTYSYGAPDLDRKYKDEITRRVVARGLNPRGVIYGLKALMDTNGSAIDSEEKRARLDITLHRGLGFTALTLNEPGQVTAERLKENCHQLGDSGATMALAILVEASSNDLFIQEAA